MAWSEVILEVEKLAEEVENQEPSTVGAVGDYQFSFEAGAPRTKQVVLSSSVLLFL